MDEIRKFIVDMQKMIPEESQKHMNCAHTTHEQGPLLAKSMVSQWSKNETTLVVMIELLRVFWEELKRGPHEIRD